MTEKNYGGSTSHGLKNKNVSVNKENNISNNKSKINKDSALHDDKNKSSEEYSDFIKAGQISIKVKEFARALIKPGMPLLEIAEKIESEIIKLGAKPAFPTNLAINDIAAHYTPAFNDTEKAHGLLKVDLGVQINGCTADTAFSLDLDNSEENKKLIEAVETALKNAISKVALNAQLNTIGSTIEETIKSFGFSPIINLSGHRIEQYSLHSGITIPNHGNSSTVKIKEGVFAIEPFATNGFGSVRDGKPSGIYHLESPGSVRDNFAREVLGFIAEEYQTLPFCSRWIYKKFGSRGLLALRQIEQSGILHHYPQLIERGLGKVAQAEHTIILTPKEKIVITN